MSLFLGFFFVLFLALSIPIGMVALSRLLGPRKLSPRKLEAYECGVDQVPAFMQGKLSVKFFLIAMFFLVFDIEIVFLYPWAVLFRELGLLGFLEALVFVVILFIGLLYLWKKGALEWE